MIECSNHTHGSSLESSGFQPHEDAFPRDLTVLAHPSAALPEMDAISIFDRWLPQGENGPLGIIELAIDFSNAPAEHYTSLFGLQRFSFPYGDLQDRCESVELARQGSCKLHDAFGLPVHDFLSHIDGNTAHLGLDPSAGLSCGVALAMADVDWTGECQRQFCALGSAADAPELALAHIL